MEVASPLSVLIFLKSYPSQIGRGWPFPNPLKKDKKNGGSRLPFPLRKNSATDPCNALTALVENLATTTTTQHPPATMSP